MQIYVTTDGALKVDFMNEGGTVLATGFTTTDGFVTKKAWVLLEVAINGNDTTYTTCKFKNLSSK